jgi:hypothetical protein
VGQDPPYARPWGLVADARFGDGAEQYFIGPRFSF